MLTLPDFKHKQILFVFLQNGEKISFSNDNIIVKDNIGRIKHQSTCYKLFILFVVGSFTVTTGILQRSKKFGFSIIFMTVGFKVYESFPSAMEGNTLLKELQYEYKKSDIAKHIIYNKILNQQDILKQIRKKSQEQKEAIKKLETYIKEIEKVESTSHLLGIEGNASKLYFVNYFDNIEWTGRKPRVKHNMVNACLDIGYTVLFNIIEGLLNVYGFDIYKGVLHKEFYKRKSLVCDIIEPFRVIIDKQVKKSINLNQFRNEDFTIYKGKYLLKITENKKYISIFANSIISEKEELFIYIQSYYRAFMKGKNVMQYPLYKIGGRDDNN